MKLFFTSVIVIFSLLLSAQTKKELPPDFFDNFKYTLPVFFNYNDSLQLQNEVIALAKELAKWQDSAAANYTISDATTQYNFTDAQISAWLILNKFDKVIENISLERDRKSTPIYSSPYRLNGLAYSKATIQHADDGSAIFKNTLAASFKSELQNLNQDFRNDIINQSKGIYTQSSTDNYKKNLYRIIEQAVKNNNAMVDFNNAFSVLNFYWQYMLRKNYQPLLENTLYTLSPARVNEEKVKIPMRDGIKINAYVYRDVTENKKLPAIVSLSPYPGGNEATRGNVFATNGYIYIYADNRGRRESEGTFVPYEDDAHDFYDIIDWISKQPWCNGKVATSGGSYLGFTQWQAIRKEYKHPALKAINPMVAVGFGIDFPRASQMFYPYMLQWATYVSGKELNDALFNDSKFWNDKSYELYKNNIPFYKFDSVINMPNSIFQKWLSHPDFDNYWKNILPGRQDFANLDIPVFTVTGYYDGDQNGALYYYNNHMKYGNEKAKANHYMLIGPYEHFAAQWQPGPVQNGEDLEKEAQIPIYKYVIWWFDWVLKGKQKPSFIKDKITYFETGSHTWKGTSSFKNLTTDSLVFYLNDKKVSNHYRNNLYSLAAQKASESKNIFYQQDINKPKDSLFLFSPQVPFSDSLYLTSPYNVVFETGPLLKDIVVSNRIIPTIKVKMNVPDADFSCNVYEIAADGKSRILCGDAVRVRYRNGGEKAMLAKPGEVVTLNFDNAYIYVKKISAGSKLRLEFELLNAPWAERNYGFGGTVSKETSTQPRIIKAEIMIGGKYASKVIVPFTKK